MISEERLRELVQRILRELEEENAVKIQRKIYMLCANCWDENYLSYLKQMEGRPDSAVYPVIPLSWKKHGYDAILLAQPSCKGILYRSCQVPEDLDQAVTVLPVVPRDVVVKTALCISDTFETSWIASCMEAGGQIVFLNSGLARFSGKEPKTYVNKILSYYKQLLEYGIELCSVSDEVSTKKPETVPTPVSTAEKAGNKRTEGRKRVITASYVSQHAADGFLYVCKGDVITDLAKDRAKYLNVVLQEHDCEVK